MISPFSLPVKDKVSSCCVIVNIGLPGWFVAIGLRVMVKQPDSRRIPGFFVVVFSVVIQFDVCSVGWYNRRMGFLERTTGCGDELPTRTKRGRASPVPGTEGTNPERRQAQVRLTAQYRDEPGLQTETALPGL